VTCAVSLSTMWARGRYSSVGEFAGKAREWGFTHIEGNVFISSRQMLDELAGGPLPISSLHCPCPNPTGPTGVPASRLSLSSIDKEERGQALRFARETIDAAARLGARAVILHMGEVPLGSSSQDRLRHLWQRDLAGSQEYRSTKEQLLSRRSFAAPPFVDTALQSLGELSRYSEQRGVLLGVETRVYIHEIPDIDEMQRLLSEVGSKSVGYWHDVGHAEVQHRLGITPHHEWLSRFRDRMIGIHLHDILGVTDHCCPGAGDLDWAMIASSLPPGMIKVCEIGEWNDETHMPGAIAFLRRQGILT